MLTFTIPLNPTTKKNGQNIVYNPKTHRRFIVQNKTYKTFEKDCMYFIPKVETIDHPVNVQAIYYRVDRRKIDLVGLHQALLDILVKYKVLSDDNYTIVHSMDGSKVIYDKGNPRVEVCITDLI